MVVHAPGTGAFTDAATGAVETDFPDWRVWRSRDHRGQPASWWASRRHAALWAEPQTVAGDTAAQLRAALAAADADMAAPAL